MIRLLMVTENNGAQEKLRDSLSSLGFACSVVTFNEAPSHLARTPYDLLLADFNGGRPGAPSHHVLDSLMKEKKLPVIGLVSPELLGEASDPLEVDDFMVAPGSAAELARRARRLLSGAGSNSNNGLIRSDGLLIDPVTCEVAVDGKIAELTFKEYEMLKLLAANPGRVYTRARLLDIIWGYDYFGGDRTVDVHIRRLRSKIEDSRHIFIETVRNIGYRFRKET